MRFFNRITLQTPESVEIDFQLAGIGNRAYALVIDYIVLGFTISLFILIWSAFAFKISDLWSRSRNDIGLWLIAILLIILFSIYVGYFVFFETLWQGQTPGKRYVKIRVICSDGKPIGLAQATLRSLLRPIDELLCLGMLLIILSNQEKRLGDLLAGTLVVQEESQSSSKKLLLSPEAEIFTSELLATADLSKVSPQHFAIIREYLHRRSGMHSEAKRAVSKKLTYQILGIIDLPEIPESITADTFLEAVYLAYQRQR